VHRRAATLAQTLRDEGLGVESGEFFDTVRVLLPGAAAGAVARAREAGYNLYQDGPDAVQVACDETTTEDQLRAVAAALAGRDVELAAEAPDALPHALRRDS